MNAGEVGNSSCSPNPELWHRRKRAFIERIKRDIEIGYLDSRVLGLLMKLNNRPRLYTTSSCSGRIVALDSNYPWERDEDNVVFKTHELLVEEELDRLASVRPLRRLWLQATGPILHVMALDVGEAVRLLGMARRAGFKHSGIMGCSEKGVLVELISGVQVTIPFKDGETLYIGKQSFPQLTRLLNDMLREGWSRINRFEKILEEDGDGEEENGG